MVTLIFGGLVLEKRKRVFFFKLKEVNMGNHSVFTWETIRFVIGFTFFMCDGKTYFYCEKLIFEKLNLSLIFVYF